MEFSLKIHRIEGVEKDEELIIFVNNFSTVDRRRIIFY